MVTKSVKLKNGVSAVYSASPVLAKVIDNKWEPLALVGDYSPVVSLALDDISIQLGLTGSLDLMLPNGTRLNDDNADTIRAMVESGDINDDAIVFFSKPYFSISVYDNSDGVGFVADSYDFKLVPECPNALEDYLLNLANNYLIESC